MAYMAGGHGCGNVSDEQLLHIALNGKFIDEVSEGISRQMGYRAYNYDLSCVKLFKIPLGPVNFIEFCTPESQGSHSREIHSYRGWIPLNDDLEHIDEKELDWQVRTLAHEVIGSYVSLVRYAVKEYGHDCGVAQWRDNLKFIARNWGPSVADPAREVGSSLAYNYRFVACHRNYIPTKKVTVEMLKEWEGLKYEEFADKVNGYFA